jgi:hypothetical protein
VSGVLLRRATQGKGTRVKGLLVLRATVSGTFGWEGALRAEGVLVRAVSLEGSLHLQNLDSWSAWRISA